MILKRAHRNTGSNTKWQIVFTLLSSDYEIFVELYNTIVSDLLKFLSNVFSSQGVSGEQKDSLLLIMSMSSTF